MPTYRTLNLANNEVKYIVAANKAQARAYVARKFVQVEIAAPMQIFEDAAAKISLVAEDAYVE